MRAGTTTRGLCLKVLLAVVVAPHAAFSQPTPATDDSFPSIAQQIEQIESSQGIDSPGLIRPLTSLGLFLQEQGDVDLAVAAFERARHLVHVNYGLSSFEEAPLLRQMVQINEGRGDPEAAWDLEQELLALIRRHPGPRAAPMLREIADKRVDLLERYAAGELPPQIVLGCYYAAPVRDGNYAKLGPDVGKNCTAGTKTRAKVQLLDEARSYYVDTIQMVLLSEGPSAPEIPALYLAWVRALYAFPDHYNTESHGRGILRNLHSRAVKSSAPLPVQMNALVQIADWDLLFAGGRKENETAFETYETLYDRLEQEGLEQSAIDEMFSPKLPVVLPAFKQNPLASTETADSSEHIDVAFDITRHGKSDAIEILDTTTSTSSAATERLVELIERSRFRPRVANGAFEDPSRVVVRYYVND